jgi:hypothetical protein
VTGLWKGGRSLNTKHGTSSPGSQAANARIYLRQTTLLIGNTSLIELGWAIRRGNVLCLRVFVLDTTLGVFLDYLFRVNQIPRCACPKTISGISSYRI